MGTKPGLVDTWARYCVPAGLLPLKEKVKPSVRGAEKGWTGKEGGAAKVKVEPKAAGYGKDGGGRPQGHHEVTHPGQRTARSTEKDEKGKKTEESVAETVYSDAERTTVLDGIFGK